MALDTISIEDVVRILNLERDPKSYSGAESFNVRCPLCGDKKYHMNINTAKNVYRCVRCSGDDRHLTAVDLYSRVRFGTPIGENSMPYSEVYISLKNELQGVSSDYSPSPARERYVEILPAEDDSLDRAYSALLRLDYLALSDEHRQSLKNRGLNDGTIELNGYASMRDVREWITEHPKYDKARELFKFQELSIEKKKYPAISRISNEKLLAGILIANDLVNLGIDPERVPGFFRFAGGWCFKVETGIMIPTRNSRHQIVGLQVRRDSARNGMPRYMTVSSKGLECGPTKNISRVHFPLENKSLREGACLYLTEGPLKADVSAHLNPIVRADRPVAFAAVQGVDNTRELMEYIDYFKSEGIDIVYEAFDMDKLVNYNVMKAEERLRSRFEAHGCTLLPVFWDMEYAETAEKKIFNLFEQNGLEWNADNENLIQRLADNICSLENSGIDYDESVTDWRENEKGIDDHLLSMYMRSFFETEHGTKI